jgi:hypothetical protein
MMRKVAAYSNALMMLTGIHHIYGAWVYHTPWRLHVLALSIPVLVINWFLVRGAVSRFKFYMFCLVNFVISVILIGLYEGMFNHLMKNLLYFSGLDKATLLQLFPPPTYVMPNDFWFELTGIAQALITVPLIYFSIKMVKAGIK